MEIRSRYLREVTLRFFFKSREAALSRFFPKIKIPISII